MLENSRVDHIPNETHTDIKIHYMLLNVKYTLFLKPDYQLVLSATQLYVNNTVIESDLC